MSSPQKRRSLRFSLFSAVSVMTLLALAAGLYGAYKNNEYIRQRALKREAKQQEELAKLAALEAKLRAENTHLRADLGFLTIRDPEQIHAVELKELRPLTWRFRVYLPPGRFYYAACRVNELPLNGKLPEFGRFVPDSTTISSGEKGSLGIGLDPGEYIITFAVVSDLDGKLRCHFDCTRPEVPSQTIAVATRKRRITGYELPNEDEWPASEMHFSTIGVDTSQAAVAADSLLILLDGRSVPDEIRVSRESSEGVIVWVAPAE